MSPGISPYKEGIGLAFYVEPGWSRIHKVEGKRTTELELELKAIVQKTLVKNPKNRWPSMSLLATTLREFAVPW